ncbi:MAG: hypothetical protein KJ626_02625 [Verrucomicrobia bacterium]|nr:hypothetical protein [Verrucomicrobiota bacterium]
MDREVVEPEILPPEEERPQPPSAFRRMELSLGPVAAGIIIDVIDFVTFGQAGIMLGLLIGGTAAYWMCSVYRLPVYQRLLWAVAAGVYCTIPRTEFIPVATIIGAFARFVNSKNEEVS